MLDHKNKISLRFKLATIAAAVLISSFTALAVHRGSLFGRAQQPQPAAPVPLAVALVPAGLPVALANATAIVESNGKLQTVSAVNLQAAVLGPDRLNNLNLMVLEFDERGLLRQVDGFVRRLDLAAGKPEVIALPIDRPIANGRRLALAVERADSTAKRWEADFNTLARGVALAVAGNPAAGVTARNDSPAPPDTGASVCSNAYRRAMALANSGVKNGLTSFSCNQHKRSFSFSFNGKSLP